MTEQPTMVPHGLGDLTDTTVWPTDRVDAAIVALKAETNRRYVLAAAPAEVERITQRYQEARGRKAGDPWVMPASALEVYGQGDVVTHNGKRWLSLIPNNVREPGEAADPQSYRWWKDLTPAPQPAPGPQPWDGNGAQYKVGDQVTYQGKTYRVLQAHQTQPHWTPTAVASLYQVVA